MFERITAVFSLLTVLPSRRDTKLDDAASALWAFPIAGLVIGAIAGGIGAVMILAGLEPLLAGVFTVAALLILTGLHHLDGLADMADALMVRGGRERRLGVLKDPAIGIGGVASVGVYLLALTSSLHALGAAELMAVVIVAEVTAKISMVVAMRAGTPAEGSSAAPFIRAAGTKSTAITVIIGIIITQLTASETLPGGAIAVAMAAGVVAALLVGRISKSSIGALRGDAIGACNEVSRLAVVIFLVGVL